MSETRSNIHLHIERLILDGLPLERSQGPHVQAAVEAELARLLTTNGLGEQFQSGGAVPSVRTAGIQLENGNSSIEIGQQIAQSVYGSIAPVNQAPPIVHDVLRSPGRPLDTRTRAFMEPRFRHDFSHVRVHTDAKAAESAQAVNALAYTVGRDIVFGAGQYQPTTIDGCNLVAHELTHTIQQGYLNTQMLPDRLKLGDRLDPAEKEATFAANAAMQDQSVPSISRGDARVRRADKKPADTEEFGDQYWEFKKNNRQLSDEEISRIRSAVLNATGRGHSQVVFEFFRYYSDHKILRMSSDEEAKARKADRYATTDAESDTKVRSDVLDPGFPRETLATVLIHEFTHTGHSVSNYGGIQDYEEGHAYGIEYFYARRSGNNERAEKILTIVTTAAVVLPAQKVSFQKLFLVSYATMVALNELINLGRSPHLARVPNLTSEDGQVLAAEFVAQFNNQSERLKNIVAEVGQNLATFTTLPSL